MTVPRFHSTEALISAKSSLICGQEPQVEDKIISIKFSIANKKNRRAEISSISSNSYSLARYRALLVNKVNRSIRKLKKLKIIKVILKYGFIYYHKR